MKGVLEAQPSHALLANPSLQSSALSRSKPGMRACYSHTSSLQAFHATPPLAPTKFHRFRELPAELRIKIWSYALPDPRTIHLVRLAYPSAHQAGCTTILPCPPAISNLLQACAESRHEVLSRYELLLGPGSPKYLHCHPHYFNPLQDGIFIDTIWPWVRGGVTSGVFKTRRLSISCNEWWDFWKCDSPQLFGKGGLLKFKHLEQIHIVFRVLSEYEKTICLKGGHIPILVHRLGDISFPRHDVDIYVEPIMRKFAEMKKANPDWNVPQVKLMAWAATSSSGYHGSLPGPAALKFGQYSNHLE